MALFKPEVKQGTSFNGICKCAIVGFEDKSAEYEWADMFINVIVKQEGSDYTRNIPIKGSVEKDANGVVTGGTFFSKLYEMFTTLGCDAGININGDWEDGKGNAITDIADYLDSRYAVDANNVNSFPYLGYFYKGAPSAPGKPSYNKALGSLVLNTAEGRANLESKKLWMQKKGYLKEFDPSATPEPVELQDAALGNL